MLNIYCDGGSRGNPGHAASAFVIYLDGKEITKQSKYIGVTTNNVAEYQAIILALEYVVKNYPNEELLINLDTELITKQLKGEYKVKNENLKKLFLVVKNLEKEIKETVTYKWSRRENNKVADLLVNQALDNR